MVQILEQDRKHKLWEMITIASPQPDGMIPIGKRGETDLLKVLLTTVGFEFLVMHPVETDELRAELDPNKTGQVQIDELVGHLEDYVEARTDDSTLEEAFGVFDADNDGKLSLEEFEFFMTGFAKEYNHLYEKKMVKEMLAAVRELADENEQFLIRDVIRTMKEIWKEDD